MQIKLTINNHVKKIVTWRQYRATSSLPYLIMHTLRRSKEDATDPKNYMYIYNPIKWWHISTPYKINYAKCEIIMLT